MPVSSRRTRDLKTPFQSAREKLFTYSRRAEAQYAVQLRKIARAVGDIINAFPPGDPAALPAITDSLVRYSSMIRPWARAVAARMIADVNHRDNKVWQKQSEMMGASLRQEVRSAPTGIAMQQLLAESVHYITSIPLDAAKRVHELTMKGISDSRRFKEYADEIQRSTHVSRSKANLIARTETARTSSVLTQVRAEHVGCVGYVWRTSRDGDVRKSHKEMEGKFVKFDEVPLLSDGTRTHAGQIYNCRCYMEPVIPDEYL